MINFTGLLENDIVILAKCNEVEKSFAPVIPTLGGIC